MKVSLLRADDIQYLESGDKYYFYNLIRPNSMKLNDDDNTTIMAPSITYQAKVRTVIKQKRIPILEQLRSGSPLILRKEHLDKLAEFSREAVESYTDPEGITLRTQKNFVILDPMIEMAFQELEDRATSQANEIDNLRRHESMMAADLSALQVKLMAMTKPWIVRLALWLARIKY
jgi:hypothetical protein